MVTRRRQTGWGRSCLLLASVIVANFLVLESLAIHDSTAASPLSPAAAATSIETRRTRKSLPRSRQRPARPEHGSDEAASAIGTAPSRFPFWPPSPSLDEDGFLVRKYQRVPGEWEREVKLRHRDRIPVPTRYFGTDELLPQEWSHADAAAGSTAAAMATVRQVPGDGSCLFHSISICLAHAENGTHLDVRSPESMDWLHRHSSELRQLAVDCLQYRNRPIFLQGHEYLKAKELVQAAASQYGISCTEYCDYMREDSYWGGGPEIVALCNVLERPIHVYDLHVPTAAELRRQQRQQRRWTRAAAFLGLSSPSGDDSQSSSSPSPLPSTSSPPPPGSPDFVLRRMACFGSPKFDRNPALHILSADSRFPDVKPGSHLPSGNHFLALFLDPPPAHQRKAAEEEDEEEDEERKQRIRGGYVNEDDASRDLIRREGSLAPEKWNLQHYKVAGWWRRMLGWL